MGWKTKEQRRAYHARPEVKERERVTHKRSRDKRKAQKREYDKTYRAANIEKRQALNRRYYAENKVSFNEKVRRCSIKYRFGITEWTYNNMCDWQGFTCAICREMEPTVAGKMMRLAIDHDHSSGVVRGLLCGNCNKAIGQLNDSPERLEAAAHYLRFNRQLVVILAVVLHFRKSPVASPSLVLR